MWELQRKYAFKADNVTRRDVRATQNGMLQMCHLICAETEKILTHNHSSLENELILLNLQTLQCTRHSFLPDISVLYVVIYLMILRMRRKFLYNQV